MTVAVRLCSRCGERERHVSMPSGYVNAWCRECTRAYERDYTARRKAEGRPVAPYDSLRKEAARRAVAEDPRYASTTRRWEECQAMGGCDPDPEDLTEARTPPTTKGGKQRWSAGAFTGMVKMPICRRCSVPVVKGAIAIVAG